MLLVMHREDLLFNAQSRTHLREGPCDQPKPPLRVRVRYWVRVRVTVRVRHTVRVRVWARVRVGETGQPFHHS